MNMREKHPVEMIDGIHQNTALPTRARRTFLSSSVLPAAAILAMTVVAIGCNSTNSPTAPQMDAAAIPQVAQLTLSEAMVIVNGQTANGMTMSPSQAQGTHTRFQATLTSSSGPAVGQSVRVSYQRPQGMTGMMGGSSGVMTLYDDGTHGDETANDGIYCLEDTRGDYGFHMADAHMGTYQYDFYGMHDGSHESNHMEVSVHLESQASQAGALTLSDAMVIVNGQAVNGMTITPSQAQGTNTRFEARLMGPDGPAVGQTVRVSYQRPQGMMGMMGGSSGVMTLYDDGTHGDETPGDGIYCTEDWDGQYGFHMNNAQMGTYHYDFYGMHDDGHESNHMEVSVGLSSQ